MEYAVDEEAEQELERRLIKDYTKASRRRASLLTAYGLFLLYNSNNEYDQNKSLNFEELLSKIIPRQKEESKNSSHIAAMKRFSDLENQSSASHADHYYEDLLSILHTDLKKNNLNLDILDVVVMR